MGVFGKLFPVSLLEGQVGEGSHDLVEGVLLLQFVVHCFELFLERLADQRLEHGEDLLGVTNSNNWLAAETVHVAQVHLAYFSITTFGTLDLLHVVVLLAEEHFGSEHLVAVEGGLAGLEVGVDEVVDADVGRCARPAGQVVDVDGLQVVDLDCVQFGRGLDACFQGYFRFETLRSRLH